MTRTKDAPRDLHRPSRPPTSNVSADARDGYRDYITPGWRQLLCAWFIVLTVAALFKIADLISATRTAPFAHATDLAQLADEIEHWERGVPRQQTMTPPQELDGFPRRSAEMTRN
jgi:hypothetical protein